MAKRLSTGQTNTILNYFQSPKTKNVKVEKLENGNKRSVDEQDDDDEVIIKQKKRKVSKIVDTDSEEESIPVQPTPKKRKNIKKEPSPDSSSGDEKPEKKRSLREYAFEKTNDSTPKKNREKSPSVPKAPVIGTSDIHSNWLHNRLDFLQPDKIRDINKNRPDHPDYDPRTLCVPKDFLDKQTPAMRQWWILKSTHMDCVLFFKVGKFYELYHMDAVVGVTQLGFNYMKGEFAHSGFPERAYEKMASSLIGKGYKVARSEQTETPEMMAERCKQIKPTKFDKVVSREICQISTKATCVYTGQAPDALNPQFCYMYAISEEFITGKAIRFGICFIDTSVGTFHLAKFDDDKHCSQLLALFAEHPPGLILTERKKISPKLNEVLNTHCRDIRKEALNSGSQFYSASDTVMKLLDRNYFRDKNNEVRLPEFLKNITDRCDPKPGYELAVKSLGACLWYLEDSKLDIQVVSMGKFEWYQPLNVNKTTSDRKWMVLDSVTMGNLSLFGSHGTLQKTLDYCQTAFGKRLLQEWICRPLCDIDKIKERQKAISELYGNFTVLNEARDILKKLPDLPRQIAKIHTYGNKFFAKDHPDSRAVFYDASLYSKRRIDDLLKTLRGFELAQSIPSLFKDCESPLLKKLTQFVPEGTYVDLSESLNFFKEAFDQEEARTKGKIIPKPGVDESYDEAERAIEDIKKKLDEYLDEQRKFFGCKVTYFGSDKKRFQIEIPESHTKKVTNDYQLEGTRKGVKRYSTAESKNLLAEMLKAESERAKIILDLNRRIFEKFSNRHAQWEQAVNCLTILDVLCSLATFARSFSQDVCIPDVEPFSESHKIIIENGRHPCISNESFVPNDTKMGIEDYASILLITGPNMGGKSTLMRQIAIICVMAQMGSYVPASKCRLNLIDRIFTRLGAHDEIVQGRSTFLVELSEASSILQHASSHSLVLLDELGRGTSTHDGTAIATAYVEKLTNVNCRTLFSTHYHSLVDHFLDRNDIQLGHMACVVKNDEDPTEESVTFLYKMAKGRCPKSYGFNVAKLAGLKHCIVARGRELAKQLEEESKNRHLFQKIFKSDVSAIRNFLSLLRI